jgi:hypothetical protein
MNPLVALAALTGLSVLVSLGLGEVALRVFDPSKIRSGWTDAWELNFTKGKYAEANQLGFRGKPIDIADGDFVVVLIGDSQVECFSCADHRLPEDALQKHLAEASGRDNVKVFSLGVSGYGADQELLALQSYFSKGYRADMVVVWQTLGNDLWNAIFPSHSTQFGAGHLKPTFRRDAQGKLIGPSRQIGETFCSSYLQCIYFIQRYGSIDGYWEQFLPPPAPPIGAPAPGDATPIVETKDSIDYEKSPWSLWLEPSSERKRYSIALTRALYDEMRSEAARHGARFVLFDVDRSTDVGLAELAKFPYFKREPQYVRFKDRLYRSGGVATYLAASHELNEGFDFIMVAIDAPNHVVSVDDPHFNENGNDRVMSLVAGQMKARGWLGR